MPQTISYASLNQVLPHQRLNMYQKVFQTTNDIELHGAYIWSVKAAASLHPLLSVLEVALRNSIHISASKMIAPDWYDKINTRTRKGWNNQRRDQRNIDWHKQQLRDIHRKLNNKTPPKGLTKHDLLVAKMDFGFWDNLLRECFSINGDKQALWPQCIPVVFPHLPKGKGYTNSTIQLEISALRELRNDIAHHSPIWKNQAVFDTSSAITYLNQRIEKIVEIIGWLSPGKVDWLEIHLLKAEAQRVVSLEYLYLCQRKDLDVMQQPFASYKREMRSHCKSLTSDQFNLVSTISGELYMVTKVSP